MVKMGLDLGLGLAMARRIGAMAVITVWLYGRYCMGQVTPRNQITQDYFNNLKSTADSCEGKSFYTYDSFTAAADQQPAFGTTGDDSIRKREMAAFLAHVIHETGGLCFISEQNPRSDFCEPRDAFPCAPGKTYIGRGPLQLTWNYNYGEAGNALGYDLLNSPETVAQDSQISFKTAFWFWMNRDCHDAMVSGRGFGDTIKAINSGECSQSPDQVRSRVDKYQQFCRDFGVDPGSNISC